MKNVNRLNKHFLLVLTLFLVFILIPSSFALDLNDIQVFSSSNLNDAVITDNGNVDNNIHVSTDGMMIKVTDLNLIHMHLSLRLLINLIHC